MRNHASDEPMGLSHVRDNGNNLGWDGRTPSGIPAAEGTYFAYQSEGPHVQGTVTLSR